MMSRPTHSATLSPEGIVAREALLVAAPGVVERAASPDVAMAEIAAEAGVDEAAAWALFPVVDDLLVEAALVQCARELGLTAEGGVPAASAYAHHFARHRRFYRAMRDGDVAVTLDSRMAQLVMPLIVTQVKTVVGARLSAAAVEELARDVTSDSFEVTNGWIVNSPDDATVESLYVQLEAVVLQRLEAVRGT